jgi:hypothetical protein
VGVGWERLKAVSG